MGDIAVVTGASGFVGGALVAELCSRGYSVRALVRTEDPKLAALPVEMVQLDLAEVSPEELSKAFVGAAVVFHTAAKVGMSGSYQEFFRSNVIGTRTVIAACKSAQVPALVFTSSPSVIADGTNLVGVDERYPYPPKYEAFYPMTKAAAEREVLSANSEALKVVALRPHIIWGPGDRHLVPMILEKARRGKLMQIGDGTNRVDVCYIDDCVAAHLAAWNALRNDRATGGKAYFVSQGEPVRLWEWINAILVAHGIKPVTKKVHPTLALALASVCELVSRILPTKPEPLLTRFLVREMATEHFFDISAARRDLGFAPKWKVSDAMMKTFGSALKSGV